MKHQVAMPNGKIVTINSAEEMVVDADTKGLEFFNEDGQLVAAFAYGEWSYGGLVED